MFPFELVAPPAASPSVAEPYIPTSDAGSVPGSDAKTVPVESSIQGEWFVAPPEGNDTPGGATDEMLHFPPLARVLVEGGTNNEGRLTAEERSELQTLVREAEEIALTNARLLAAQRLRLRRSPPLGWTASNRP